MSNYIYKDPVDQGFIKFKLSSRQHKILFSKRKRAWWNHYDYYISKDEFIMHKTTSFLFKIFVFFAFPIVVTFGGLSNIKEILRDYSYLFREKQRGHFSMDSCCSTTDKYKQIKSAIHDR